MSKPVNILVITYWKFSDALVQTYTLPYLRIIRELLPPDSCITLITLEPEGEIRKEETIEQGIVKFSFRLRPFGIRAALEWNRNIRTMQQMIRDKQIAYIHSWCTPAGAIGYRLSVKSGIPLIVDSFEPHAEPMVETGTWTKGGPAFRTLFRSEKKQVLHAKWVIGVVEAMKQYAKVKYAFTGRNFLSKPACIDLTHFTLSKRKNPALLQKLGLENSIVCVYAGKFGGLYMKEEAFQFFSAAREEFGEQFKVLLLTSTPEDQIAELCKQARLDPTCVVRVFVPHAEVPEYMGLGDFGFSAFKPVESRKYCTPIKNGEYWAMGLPVVIGKGISDDSDIIQNANAGYVLDAVSTDEFRNAAKHIRQLLLTEDRDKLANRIQELAQKHRNFAIAKSVYKQIYSDL